MLDGPYFLRQSTAVPDVARPDVLSDILDLVDVRGVVTGGFAVRGPWVSHGAVSRPLKLIAVVAGSARLSVDGPGGPEGPLDLAPGDVALLNHRTWLEVRGSAGEGPRVELVPGAGFDAMDLASANLATDDVLVGGWIEVSAPGLALLRAALPGVVHVRAAAPAAHRLGGIVARIFDEASRQQLGTSFALRQNGQLLLLETLRACSELEGTPIGWLRLLADAPLAPALQLMHQQPGEPWTLHQLARAAGMSRTSFAERFRAVAGTPPLTYLSRWRMLRAQRALHDPDVRIAALAAELGYGSDSAFSTAFRREVGQSPLQYRQQVQTTTRARRHSPAPGDATPSRRRALRPTEHPETPAQQRTRS